MCVPGSLLSRFKSETDAVSKREKRKEKRNGEKWGYAKGERRAGKKELK